jgi:hypothetical protein
MREGHPIQYTGTYPAAPKIMESKEVGRTKYGHRELIKIGEALIESFGNYHRLFWNCQVFAECFLYLITRDEKGSFTQYNTTYSMLIIEVDFGGCFSVIFVRFCSQSAGDHNIENETLAREAKTSCSSRVRRIPQGFGAKYRYTISS